MDNDDIKKAQAIRYWQQAYEQQMQKRFADAIALYMKSIELYPTAEAHTYLGWTYSLMGRLEDTIEECHKAIEVDPTFGNPYNDIGAGLIEMGEHDAAVPWLEKAILAPRSESRAFPHVNLARVWEHRCEWEKAIESYKRALYEEPGHQGALVCLKKLRAKQN